MAQGQLDISQELPPHVTPLEEIPNVICLPATPQLKVLFPSKYRMRTAMLIFMQRTKQGIYTILRDKTSSRADFIFFADRLATLVIEKAMDMLPFAAVRITTPIEAEMVGKRLSVPHASVCGISIIRSGGPLEQGLRRVMGDVALGAMLIQTENKTTEPLLLHSMLPVCIQDRKRAKDAWVFLLDAQVCLTMMYRRFVLTGFPQIGTGASALMAIRILLDHGVQENRIIFACFLVAKNGGVKVIQQAFPGVRIITGAADDGICEEVVGNDGEDWRVWSIEPGMGHIGMNASCS